MKPVKSTVPVPSVHLQAVDNPFHLIPRQSEDFAVCMDTSWDPSPVDFTASSWIDLGPHGPWLGCLGDEDSAWLTSVEDKIRSLEKTVALL